jgi:hypothetical protein
MNFAPGEIIAAAAPLNRARSSLKGPSWRDDMVQALGLWGLDRLDPGGGMSR